MKFLHRPVTAFEDATANFEQLEARSILDLTPTNVLQLGFTGPGSIDGGNVSLVWTASATATPLVVTHHLKRLPKSIAALVFGGDLTVQYTFSADTLTTSAFTLHGFRSASTTLTLPVFWLAIG